MAGGFVLNRSESMSLEPVHFCMAEDQPYDDCGCKNSGELNPSIMFFSQTAHLILKDLEDGIGYELGVVSSTAQVCWQLPDLWLMNCIVDNLSCRVLPFWKFPDADYSKDLLRTYTFPRQQIRHPYSVQRLGVSGTS